MAPGIDFFTPLTGSIGGALIGLSAATLLVLSGDVLGASGLASSVVLQPVRSLTDPTVGWKVIFLSVFLLFSNLVLARYFTDDERLGQDPSIPVVSTYGYLLGGFFVGFGTRLSNGCTTGHGICGMARLSPRSIVAVCTFMMFAFATASVVAPDNELFSSGTAWLRTDQVPVLYDQWRGFGASMFIVLPSLYVLYNIIKVGRSVSSSLADADATTNDDVEKAGENPVEISMKSSTGKDAESVELATPPSSEGYGTTVMNNMDTCDNCNKDDQCQCCEPEQKQSSDLTDQEKSDSLSRLLPSTLGSLLFAVGLAISEMVLPSKVLGFLNLFTISRGTYDPTLLTVMIGGCVVSMISYQFIAKFSLAPSSWTWMPRLSKPLVTGNFCIPTTTTMDAQLIGGAACFGIGWALAGLCPGPAIFLFASGAVPVIRFWWPAFLVGSFIAGWIKNRKSNQ